MGRDARGAGARTFLSLTLGILAMTGRQAFVIVITRGCVSGDAAIQELSGAYAK